MLRCFCWFVLALLGCPWLWAHAKVTQEEVLLTWNPSSATPVTQILLKLGSGNNFPTGSVFTLYGME